MATTIRMNWIRTFKIEAYPGPDPGPGELRGSFDGERFTISQRRESLGSVPTSIILTGKQAEELILDLGTLIEDIKARGEA